jgi:hypothetical protein
MSGAFPPELKKQLQNIRNEFHLVMEGPNNWNLYPFTTWRAEYQPGTGLMPLEINNENPDQPVQFVLSSGPENSATAISLDIDGDHKVRIPLDLPPGHHIKYTGGSYVYLYDSAWQLVNTGQLIQYDLTLNQGKHKLGFEAAFTATGPKQGIKIEMKTAGLAHHLSMKND